MKIYKDTFLKRLNSYLNGGIQAVEIKKCKNTNEYDITISIEDINLQISNVISAINFINDKYYNGEIHFRNKYIEL